MCIHLDASSNGTNSTNSGCKPKCYTFKVGGMKCEINCTPPVLEKPTEPPYAAAGMQQNPYMPYPVQAQVPCAPPGCQATQGYPQVPYGVQPQYGAQMPAPVQQAPMQAGCLTGAPACRTGSRKSDEGSESGKDKDKDEEKGEQFPSKVRRHTWSGRHAQLFESVSCQGCCFCYWLLLLLLWQWWW